MRDSANATGLTVQYVDTNAAKMRGRGECVKPANRPPVKYAVPGGLEVPLFLKLNREEKGERQ